MPEDPEERLEAARGRISQLGESGSADWGAAFQRANGGPGEHAGQSMYVSMSPMTSAARQPTSGSS